MNENLLQYWEKVKQYWNRYNRTTKITFIATVLLLILTAAIISINLSKTEYSLAFTELQPSDAASIKSYLDTAKIPYHLSTDGKSIEVPTSEVANVKLGVESQGLNKNGSLGFEAFSGSSSFGITDNEFKVKYLSAIQGELQQLINSNQAIASSKVLISLPEEGPFLQQQAEKATASVVLQVKQGYTLDQPKVDTIYNLVSHSVKNLPIENITISDQYGQGLNSSKLDGGTSQTLISGTDINTQFRNDLQKSINNMLGNMFGRDKVNVNVFTTMNFDQKKTKEQLVRAPNQVDQKGLEISLQKATESYQSNGADNGGVPGTGSTDVPGYPGTSTTGKSNSEKTSETVNYEVDRITNDIISTPYVVKDLSINVGIEPPVKDDPNSLTAETKTAVQNALVNIVRTALADNKTTYTDEELQKKVTVFAHSFARTSDATATKTSTYLTYGALALAALAIGAVVGFAIRRRRKASQQLLLDQEMNVAATKAELPTIDIENVTNDNQVRKQLETLAKKRPEDFVNLLRTWLVDE
ncbi:flagellar M-ring protein FliF [Paenibacillus pectinilyticus]|uniref:Flagellar M-ring protein n=1 Tax=Paenibacillus pectinilyticus TaxID=512399 RepID=A0A1C1A0D6_9BACL|nr:flagellar basal-body MS-ring/collar protein FliF [Paenibacillus pectinilyticus]OCT13819.1 flagellar M-ring protein FliF [Paenibacillus pectinilyticus]